MQLSYGQLSFSWDVEVQDTLYLPQSQGQAVDANPFLYRSVHLMHPCCLLHSLAPSPGLLWQHTGQRPVHSCLALLSFGCSDTPVEPFLRSKGINPSQDVHTVLVRGAAAWQ